ncbi:MAG: sugar phosphate isomerase/epimerase family protein [Bacteroidales bacterium]|jgi:hexulose-6-phosphate isomerase|nr:sugar phosphate isomerase/epimerase family protein [Bacteroidales bacterium]
MNRREFSKKTVMASAVLSAVPLGGFSRIMNPSGSGTLKKGIMWGSIAFGETIMDKFRAAKAAGFDGVEPMSHLNRDEVLRARDATGLTIPSVCGALHWKYLLSDPDPKVRQEGVDALKTTLEDARHYGADTVLLVPGRVNESVTYDECWKRSTEEIKKALPFAQELNVAIAIENVWNNFLLSPVEAAYYVDQFYSPLVKFYFDCGNILAFGWPEQWIRILGQRIAKIHIKEYSRKLADEKGKSAGFRVNLREGDVNWSEVIKALDEIGYAGWTTIEQPGGDTPEGLKDLCDRLQLIHQS